MTLIGALIVLAFYFLIGTVCTIIGYRSGYAKAEWDSMWAQDPREQRDKRREQMDKELDKILGKEEYK